MYDCRFCDKKFSTSVGRSIHEGHKHDITVKITKDFLISKYVNERMTIEEISSITGFGEWQISQAFKKLGIQTRSVGEALRVRGTMSGENHPLYGTKGGFYGKHHSDESKRKKSNAMKDYLRIHPEAIERLKQNLKKCMHKTGKDNPNWRGGHYKKCDLCGNKFWVQPSEEKTRFCSIICANQWMQISGIFNGENNPNWHGGLSFEPYTVEFNGKLKKRIKDRDGNRCKLCSSVKRLGVHHIDYDKYNYRDENLITLCTSCNSKVNFKREYWEKALRNMLNNKHEQIYARDSEIEKNPPQIVF